MSIKKTFVNILIQLKEHAPFTFFGAAVGLTCMLLFKNMSHTSSEKLFQVFHPAHVFLSALVTAGLFRLKSKHNKFIWVLLIGYFGSIGVATMSDSLIPFLGENVMGIAVPTHKHVHEHHDHETHNADASADNEHLHHDEESTICNLAHHDHSETYHPKLHLGFIEDWYTVTPAALLGILFAYFIPYTKLPHAAHVLISTWASSAHIMMNTHREITPLLSIVVLFVLFISVWLPCCISDIVFPMFFIKDGESHTCCCHHHHNKNES